MSYHNINTSYSQGQVSTNILTYINGAPLFATIQQALDYGVSIGLSGYHTHTFQGVVGYMAGFDHSEATLNEQQVLTQNIQAVQQKKITSFNVDTSDLSRVASTRSVKVIGDIGAEFSLQVIQNSSSSSTLDKFYNFKKRTFESQSNHNHIAKVKLSSNSYSTNIKIPSTTVEDYRVLLIANEKSNTKISSDIVNGNNAASKTINQVANVTVTFVFKTSNTNTYNADPPSSNIAITNAANRSVSETVDIAKTLTNTSSDANGFGLIVSSIFRNDQSFFIEQNQTVNGAITSATSFLLDDTSNITVGSVITAVDGGSLSGTPSVISIVEKLVEISSAQTFADNRVLTFKTTGNSNIEQATGFKFQANGLSQLTNETIIATTAAKNDSADLGDKVQRVAKTVRADGSVTEATDGSSATVTLNGTYGITGGDNVVVSGIDVPSNKTVVSEVSTVSSSAGAVTLNSAVGPLQNTQEITFIGCSQTYTLSGSTISVSKYPSENITVNLDLDSFITPGTAS